MKPSCLQAIGACIVLILLVACDRNADLHKGHIDILGGSAEITIVGVSEEKARAAIQAVEQDLKRLDQIGYTFEPTGELHELNAALAEGRSFVVSQEFGKLLQTAAPLAGASNGMFNPAAGELTAMWEFHCKQPDCTESPYPEEVQKLIDEREKKVIARHPSMKDLVFDGNRVSSRNPEVKLEFGDIIRGYALDRGMQHLRALGIEDAMIQLGGGVRTIGARGDHPWWVGVPITADEHIIGFIENISGEAVVTVRAVDKSIGRQDTIYRHVVDPRSGLPVRDIQSVTVVHDFATQANVAASVFLINGIQDWSAVARLMDVQALLIVTADGTIYTSPRMEERLHWKQDVPHQHLVPDN